MEEAKKGGEVEKKNIADFSSEGLSDSLFETQKNLKNAFGETLIISDIMERRSETYNAPYYVIEADKGEFFTFSSVIGQQMPKIKELLSEFDGVRVKVLMTVRGQCVFVAPDRE
jgi:predicted ATP-dependent Lon-type protease